MKKFVYEAIDRKTNETVEGILSAKTLEEVIMRLLQEQRYPTRVEELTQQSFIAHGRLGKLRELRDKLVPPEVAPNVAKPKSPQRVNWVVIATVLFWLAAIVVYVITTAS
jgi:hypothetical protein